MLPIDKQLKKGIRLASDLKDCPSTVPNNWHVKKNASFFVIAKKKTNKMGRAHAQSSEPQRLEPTEVKPRRSKIEKLIYNLPHLIVHSHPNYGIDSLFVKRNATSNVHTFSVKILISSSCPRQI
jgi:hypothetical protein